LKAQADAITQLRHPQTRRYLTPAQVATAFAPTSATQSALIAYMQGRGFSLTNTYKDRLIIGFNGTIAVAEKAFGVQINNYRAPDGRIFYAPSNEPGMPTSLAPDIQSIIGLDDAIQYTHLPAQAKSVQAVAQTNNISCLPAQPGPIFTYYVPSQIQSAYNLVGLYNQGYQGQGQTIALLELDDYNSSDISAYTACYGGSSVPVSRILVNGGTGLPPGSHASEVELDMNSS
jgi:kumamolisin